MKKGIFFAVILVSIGLITQACIFTTPFQKSNVELSPTTETVKTNTVGFLPTDTLAPTAPLNKPPALATITMLPTIEGVTTVEPTPENSPEPCSIIAKSEITIYMRPSKEAQVFAKEEGPIGYVYGKTKDGWLGFDPGVAQAPNVGVFRLRWVPPEADIETKGDCDAIPVVWSAPPHVCFAMLMTDANIYQLPNENSPVITTVSYGQYAQAIGRHGDDWIKLDLSVGNMNMDAEGWVELYNMSYNGDCGDLPEMDH